jgi:hypothetical protein
MSMRRFLSAASAQCGRTRRGLLSSTALLLGASSLLLLSGCGIGTTATGPGDPTQGAALKGMVHGGRQPVGNAQIALYAASTAGYPSDSRTPNTPLVTTSTDPGGNFTLPSYTCPAVTGGSQVYIVAVGGNPGNPVTDPNSGNNPNLVLMSALGTCPSGGELSSGLFIDIDEVSTVASAYALAPFMTYPGYDSNGVNAGSAPYVGTSSTNTLGLANAFATVSSLMNISTGQAYSVTPSYTASGVTAANMSYVPQARINTLANILAACVNSDGGEAQDGSVCGSLFDATTTNATQGFPPTDTLQAISFLAQSPGLSIGAATELYGIQSNQAPGLTAPYSPAMNAQPNDWTLALGFTGGGFGQVNGGPTPNVPLPSGMAIDAQGNVWITGGEPEFVSDSTQVGNGFVAKFDNQGNALSLATTATTLGGYQAGGISLPRALAVDLSGRIWVGNDNATMSVLNSDGTPAAISTVSGSGLLHDVESIAVDSSGNIWAGSGVDASNIGAGAVAEFNSMGVLQSPSGGYTGGGNYLPVATLAFDPSGNLWGQDLFHQLFYLAPSNNPNAYNLNPNIAGGTGYALGINSAGNVITFDGGQGYVAKVSGTSGNITDFFNSRMGNALTLDGKGKIWSVGPAHGGADIYNNIYDGFLDEYSATGAPLSPATTGFTGTDSGTVGTAYPPTMLDAGLTNPEPTGEGNGSPQVAVDASGNVWVLNPSPSQQDLVSYYLMVKFVGLASPTITPIAAALPNKQTTMP